MRRAATFPFLGGPISAVLVGLCFEPYGSRILPWFALSPLIYSLQRHKGQAWMRWIHGMLFGYVLCLGFLPWGFEAGLAEESVISAARAGLLSIAAWTGFALIPGAFSLAAGPLLRSRAAIVPLVGIPVLWTGCEVLRGPFSILPVWLSNWLSLGYAIPSGTPEAQLAALFGVYGLSFLLCLSSTAWVLVCRERLWTRQSLFALAGCLIPLACRGLGALALPADPLQGTATVMAAAKQDEGAETLVELSAPLGAQGVELVVWPAIPVAELKGEGEVLLSPPAERFLRESSSYLLGHACGEPGAAGAPKRECLFLMDREGKLAGRHELKAVRGACRRESARKDGGVIRCSLGTLGVGTGSDHDSPAYARAAVDGGAALLVSSTAEVCEGREDAVEQRRGMQALRAVECRRWFVASGTSGAFIVDPYGRTVFRILRGIESAGTEEVEFLSGESFYCAVGWWVEPTFFLAAAGICVWAILRLRLRRPPSASELGGAGAGSETSS